MKKYVLIIFCMSALLAYAGPHTLQKGESYSDIAALYNLPLDSILKANEGVTEYTGYTIEVPLKTLVYDLGDNDFFRSLRFGKGNYNKGQKKYQSGYHKQMSLFKISGNKRNKVEEEIIKDYTEAIKSGNVDALYQMGRMKVHGKFYANDSYPTFDLDVNEDVDEFREGIEYLQIAAILGNNKKALIELALACGYESSPIRNPYLCLSMLENYYNELSVPVDNLICYMYENGYGVCKNLMQAYIYSPSKELIDTGGGKTPREKILEAIEALPVDPMSSRYGNGMNSETLFSIGLTHYKNEKIDSEGLFWLQRAARQNNADASWALAIILKNGNFTEGACGSSFDIESQALAFAEKAVSNGKQEAKDYVAAYREQERKKAEYERELALQRYREKEEKKQRRREMWANVIGSVAQAAAQTYVAIEQSKQFSRQNASYTPSILNIGQMSESQWAANNQLALQQILQYTVNKTVADWNGTPMIPTDMSAVNLGSDMSPGSPLWMWGKQQEINRMSTQNARMQCEISAFYKRQADMITQQMMNNPFQPIAGYVDIDGNWNSADMVGGMNADLSSNNAQTSTHDDIRSKNSAYYSERYGNKQCHLCSGSGTCSSCNGRGYSENTLGVSGVHECPNCYIEYGKKNGKCRACAGKGYVYGLK